MNELGKRFFALSFALIVSVLAIEVAMRLVEPGVGYADTSVDRRFYAYRLAPNWREPRQRPEELRILVLGDSFTWGSGVHAGDAYPQRMQRRLNLPAEEDRYRVYNAGRNGLNTVRLRQTVDEMRFLEVDPDLVILGFVFNDPEPTDPAARKVIERPVERRAPVGRAELELYQYSALYRLVYDRLENSRQHRAADTYLRRLFVKDTPHWKECVEALESLRDLFAEREIPFLAIQFPTFDEPFDEDYPHRHIHEQMKDTFDALGIRSIDLLPFYDNVETRRLAVIPFTDAHPNEIAHRIAADYLAEWVRQNLRVEVAPDGSRRRRFQDE